MKKFTTSVSVGLIFLFSALTNEAFGQDCRQYMGKGYCVDYIKNSTLR